MKVKWSGWQWEKKKRVFVLKGKNGMDRGVFLIGREGRHCSFLLKEMKGKVEWFDKEKEERCFVLKGTDKRCEVCLEIGREERHCFFLLKERDGG